MRFVIVPGLDGSDESHWQSRWEADWGSLAVRIEPLSWTEPDLDDWDKAIAAAVTRADSDVVLVAHSLGCLVAAHWAAQHPESVSGVFLVAPPDRFGPSFPAGLVPSFATLAEKPLNIPGLVVYSDDDPYCTPEAAQRQAAKWGLPLTSVGPYGHLNSASGLHGWETGRSLLTALLAEIAGLRLDGRQVT